MGRRLLGPGALLAATVALAGCAGAQSGGGAVPYPRGSWSAGEQGAFMGACSAATAATYCACALGDVMQRYPRAGSLHGAIRSTGTRAAKDQQRFPDCTAQ